MPKSTDTGPFRTKHEDAIAALRDLAEQRTQIDEQYRNAVAQHLVDARLEGRFPLACLAAGLSRTACLRITRKWNEKGGRSIRWSDNLDPTSPTSFEG